MKVQVQKEGNEISLRTNFIKASIDFDYFEESFEEVKALVLSFAPDEWNEEEAEEVKDGLKTIMQILGAYDLSYAMTFEYSDGKLHITDVSMEDGVIDIVSLINIFKLQ